MTQRNESINSNGKRTETELNSDSENRLIFENKIAADQAVQLSHLHWMTTVEAAKYLRVSVGSIKNMVYRGRLLPKKLGRLNRFLKDDLDRTLKSSFNMKGAF